MNKNTVLFLSLFSSILFTNSYVQAIPHEELDGYANHINSGIESILNGDPINLREFENSLFLTHNLSTDEFIYFREQMENKEAYEILNITDEMTPNDPNQKRVLFPITVISFLAKTIIRNKQIYKLMKRIELPNSIFKCIWEYSISRRLRSRKELATIHLIKQIINPPKNICNLSIIQEYIFLPFNIHGASKFNNKNWGKIIKILYLFPECKMLYFRRGLGGIQHHFQMHY